MYFVMHGILHARMKDRDCNIVHPDFWPFFEDIKVEQYAEHIRKYGSLLGLSRQTHAMVIPLCVEHHWIVAIVFVRSGVAVLMDSLMSSGLHKRALRLVKKMWCCIRLQNPSWRLSESFSSEHISVPQQDDGTSCGPLSCINAFHLLQRDWPRMGRVTRRSLVMMNQPIEYDWKRAQRDFRKEIATIIGKDSDLI